MSDTVFFLAEAFFIAGPVLVRRRMRVSWTPSRLSSAVRRRDCAMIFNSESRLEQATRSSTGIASVDILNGLLLKFLLLFMLGFNPYAKQVGNEG